MSPRLDDPNINLVPYLTHLKEELNSRHQVAQLNDDGALRVSNPNLPQMHGLVRVEPACTPPTCTANWPTFRWGTGDVIGPANDVPAAAGVIVQVLQAVAGVANTVEGWHVTRHSRCLIAVRADLLTDYQRNNGLLTDPVEAADEDELRALCAAHDTFAAALAVSDQAVTARRAPAQIQRIDSDVAVIETVVLP